MNLEFFILWLAVLFPLVYSPGPGNILCAVCGAANTFRGAVPFILGLDVVYTSYAVLMGLGLGAVIQPSAGLHRVAIRRRVVSVVFGVFVLRPQRRRRQARSASINLQRRFDFPSAQHQGRLNHHLDVFAVLKPRAKHPGASRVVERDVARA